MLKKTTYPTLFVESIKIGALDLNGGACMLFFHFHRNVLVFLKCGLQDFVF